MTEEALQQFQAALAALLHDDPAHFVAGGRARLQQPPAPTQRELMAALLALRATASHQEDAEAEERVLDALDWAVGWCSPGSLPPVRA